MNTPYARRGLNLTRADLVEWFRYERANRRAASQYVAMPIAFGHAPAVQTSRPTPPKELS